MSFRVLLVGGGSGGHAYPLVAVAQSLRIKAQERGLDLDLLVMGDDGFLRKAAEENGIRFRHIMAGKFRRYFSPLLFLDLIKIPIGFIQCLWFLYWYMPDVIFSKGGYDSVPPALAGRLYAIPLYIHESDSYPGLANSFLSRFARKVFISFETVKQYLKNKNIELVGNPLRLEILSSNRDAGVEKFNLNPAKKTLLVLGGSQGAKQINDLVLASLVRMVSEAEGGYQVIHQCGASQMSLVQSEVDRLLKEGEGNYADSIRQNYRVYPFLTSVDLAMAYGASDVVISRAGAGSIFESAALGKPTIVIPLHPSAGNHQFLNAVEFAKYGAVIIEGDDATTNILFNQLKHILDPERYAQISEQIKGFAHLDAADKIAEAILAK